MSEKTPLRTPFQPLPGVSVQNESTLYRRIFKSLGLGTSSALYHFWLAVQSNVRRMNENRGLPPQKCDDLPNPDLTVDDQNRGFDVEMIEEDPDGEINPCFLGCGVLILGDNSIAAYDADGTNVLIAVREDSCVVVYNARELFATYLCDELRLQFARAIAVPTGVETSVRAAQAGSQSALAALLGLGYMITPGNIKGESYISATSRAGRTVSLTVQHMAGLLNNILTAPPSRLSDPEWVFDQIRKQASISNAETPE